MLTILRHVQINNLSIQLLEFCHAEHVETSKQGFNLTLLQAHGNTPHISLTGYFFYCNPFNSGLSYLYCMAEVSIGEALKEFLKNSKLKSGVQALQIEDAWEKIMGKTIARYTDKIEIINSTLFISSTVAPLKNELLYQKEKIIERVNEALGEKVIKEVVMR